MQRDDEPDGAVAVWVVATACLRATACDPVPAAVVGQDRRVAAQSGAAARLHGDGLYVECEGRRAHAGQAGDGRPPGAVGPARAACAIVERDEPEALRGWGACESEWARSCDRRSL